MAQFCFIGGFSFVQQAEDTEALTEFQFRSQFTDGFLSADDFFLSLEMFPQPVGEAVFPGLCAGTVDVLENAAYPSGLCAERTTLFYANSQHPDQAVTTLAIAARNEHNEFLESPIPPCGACRQVMLETEKRFKHPMRVLLYGKKGIYELKNVGELLPLSFDASAMK